MVLSVAYMQAVRMIRDHTHEMGQLLMPPKFSANHSSHTTLIVKRVFTLRGCSCAGCADTKRRLISLGAAAAVTDLFQIQHVDPTDYVLDRFRKGETNAKMV